MIRYFKPAPDLAQAIEFCWRAPPVGSGSGTSFHQLFPGSAMDLVLRFSPSGCRMALLGPATRKSAVKIHGASEYLGVRFRTGQAPLLADVQAADLVDGRLELDRLGQERVDSLADRFLSRPDPVRSIRTLQDILRDCRPMLQDERVRHAACLADLNGGRLRAGELAAMTGLHLRTLERLFLRHLGLPPKMVCRLARLKALLLRLRAGGHGSLADLALLCGYADQPHMIRDFKLLTGHVPGEIDGGFTGRLEGPPAEGVIHRYRPARAS